MADDGQIRIEISKTNRGYDVLVEKEKGQSEKAVGVRLEDIGIYADVYPEADFVILRAEESENSLAALAGGAH